MVSNQFLIRFSSILLGILWVGILIVFVPSTDTGTIDWHAFLVDVNDGLMGYFSLQVMMWIAFFYCLSEIVIRWASASEQALFFKMFSLYSNPDKVEIKRPEKSYFVEITENLALTPEIISEIFRVKKKALDQKSLVYKFFRLTVFQFQSTNNVGDVYSVVQGATESELHRVELNYTVIRYLAWLIPTLGFIGTVIGIAAALATAAQMDPQDPQLLEVLTGKLAVSFYTTLLALILSAVVMVMMQLTQAQEEQTINDVSSGFMEQVVTNLVPKPDTGDA